MELRGRRGMATGMAIMGFGGGAMIGAPLAVILMNGGVFGSIDLGSVHQTLSFAGFKTANDPGVWQTFLTLGAGYFCFMIIGAFRYRLPPAGWRPDGWTPPSESKTPQFWLIWGVLFLNVSAGIGVIGMASPMLQEIFAGSLIGLPDIKFNA